MELKTKKRIVGVIILIAMGLIIIPMFFGRSVSTDELKLSGHVPKPPALPVGLNTPLPPRDATVPAIADQSTAAGGLVFEQLESVPLDTTKAEHHEAAAAPAPVKSAAPTKVANPSDPAPAPTPAAPVTEPTAVFANPEEPSVLPEVAIVPPAAKEAKPALKTKKTKPSSSATAAHKEANTVASPESWAVQLGSFSDRISASNLMKKLQGAGFTAYMHDSKTAQGNLVRVLVGPQLHRSDANKIQKQLQQQFSLKSIIVKVTP